MNSYNKNVKRKQFVTQSRIYIFWFDLIYMMTFFTPYRIDQKTNDAHKCQNKTHTHKFTHNLDVFSNEFQIQFARAILSQFSIKVNNVIAHFWVFNTNIIKMDMLWIIVTAGLMYGHTVSTFVQGKQHNCVIQYSLCIDLSSVRTVSTYSLLYNKNAPMWRRTHFS